LDEPGEFWVDNQNGRGRIYLRLPNDVDPNSVTIEAGRHVTFLDATQLDHVYISGLTFRFSNVHWDYNIPQWAHPDVKGAVLRLNGTGDDIRVQNCTFEHVNIPIRFGAADGASLGDVRVNDNVVRYTDHGAFYIESGPPSGLAKPGSLHKNLEMLRNNLYHVGWRIVSGEHGHGVNITYPETSHVAGNFLHRIAGWGISVTGGKPGGTVSEAPLSRHLIHHNRVQDVLLKSNDWGGIETWQGGPFYIFNNIVINPSPLRTGRSTPTTPTASARSATPIIWTARSRTTCSTTSRRAATISLAPKASRRPRCKTSTRLKTRSFTTPFSGSPKSRASKTPAPPARAICRTSSKIHRA
jgi:hypothetical protein